MQDNTPPDTNPLPPITPPTPENAPKEPEEFLPPIELPPEDKHAGKPSEGRWQRIKSWYAGHKKISLPLTFLALIAVLAIIPWSRYHAAALVIKKDVTIKVTDATAGTPVSGARVVSGSRSATTNSNGVATLKLPVGAEQVSISKKYYSNASSSFTVPIFGTKSLAVKFKATGRQVGVVVKDLLSGRALSSVDIEVAGISAKTDDSGKALLVLPAGVAEQQASLSLDGYNDLKAPIKVSDQTIEQNELNLTPSGKIYFLSKRTGKLNVMKANLDGTNAQVVVAATGYESVDSSALSTSPDGKYVAYETQRSASDKTPQLFILSTADDQLITFDSGNYNFSLIDWFGDNIIYKAVASNDNIWQSGHEKLKSYNATTGKTAILDSSAGTDLGSDAGESYDSVYLTAAKVVFDKNWRSQGTDDLSNHKDSVLSVNPDGTGKQTVGSYAADTSSIALYQSAPNSFYIQIYDLSGSGADTYYNYTVGGSFVKVAKPSDSKLYSNDAYYFSPDRSQTYWSEIRDGKDTLITADAYGSDSSQKVQAAGYIAAGWYTNKYLISTNKDQNELYVMSVGGQAPVKVADYQSTYVY